MMLSPQKKKRKGDELALDKMMEEAEYEEYEKMKPMLSIEIMKAETEEEKKKKKK